MQISIERMIVGVVFSTIFMLAVVQGAAACLKDAFSLPEPVAVIDLTITTLLVALISLLVYNKTLKINFF